MKISILMERVQHDLVEFDIEPNQIPSYAYDWADMGDEPMTSEERDGVAASHLAHQAVRHMVGVPDETQASSAWVAPDDLPTPSVGPTTILEYRTTGEMKPTMSFEEAMVSAQEEADATPQDTIPEYAHRAAERIRFMNALGGHSSGMRPS